MIDTYFTMDRVKDSEFVREYKRIFEVFKDLEVGHFDENDIYFAKGLEFDTGINRIILEFKDYLII